MAGCRRNRGATLTIFVIAAGLVITALGTAFLTSAEQAYRLAVLRNREAVLFASADAGLVEALERLRRKPGTAVAFSFTRDGARVTVNALPNDPRTLLIKAEGPDGLQRTLEAKIEPAAPGGPRVASVSRM